MENKKEIFVIRPSRTVKIKRMEKDINKLQEIYDLGIEDGKNIIEDLKKYLYTHIYSSIIHKSQKGRSSLSAH